MIPSFLPASFPPRGAPSHGSRNQITAGRGCDQYIYISNNTPASHASRGSGKVPSPSLKLYNKPAARLAAPAVDPGDSFVVLTSAAAQIDIWQAAEVADQLSVHMFVYSALEYVQNGLL